MEKVTQKIYDHMKCDFHDLVHFYDRNIVFFDSFSSTGFKSYTDNVIVSLGEVYGFPVIEIKNWDRSSFYISLENYKKVKQLKLKPLVLKKHKDFIKKFIEKNNYEKFNIRLNKGLLISGEPGNGKTQLLRYIESEYDANFLNMRDFLGERFGKDYCSIECIDDIDLDVFKDSDPRSHTLLSILDQGGQQVTRFFTTNKKIECIPTAFLRPGRINEVYHIDNPNREEREDFFVDFPVNLTDETNGFSYAKLQFLKMCLIDQDFNIDKAWERFNNQISFSEKQIGFKG